VGAAMLAAASAPAAPRTSPVRARRSVPAPRIRRDLLLAALTDPFNVVLLCALLVVGALLGTVALMAALGALVYVAGVVRSYRDPETAERLRDGSR
jgi:hypothetical protein